MDTELLARKYAPILHFHPNEGLNCCFPSDAEEVYEHYHRDWSLFREDRTPKSLNMSAPCYFETWIDEDLVQIRYWIWYKFNDFPGGFFGIGKHLGDWEHIEVRIIRGLEPVWLLSNHLSARAATLNGFFPGLITEQPRLEEDHIHSWVALGSHSNYPSPTSRPRCYARVRCDKIADGGSIWYTEQVLKSLSDTNFSTFRGRWGDKRAPRSPANEYNNRWRNAPNLRPVY